MARQQTPQSLVRAQVCARYGVYPGTSREVPCYWCGASGTVSWARLSPRQVFGWPNLVGLEWDHFIPTSLGGLNTADNIVLACRFCNRSRCNRAAPKERR